MVVLHVVPSEISGENFGLSKEYLLALNQESEIQGAVI